MSTEIASFSSSTASLKFTRYCGSKIEQLDSGSQYRERLQVGSVSLSCEEAVDLAVKLLEMFPVNST